MRFGLLRALKVWVMLQEASPAASASGSERFHSSAYCFLGGAQWAFKMATAMSHGTLAAPLGPNRNEEPCLKLPHSDLHCWHLLFLLLLIICSQFLAH